MRDTATRCTVCMKWFDVWQLDAIGRCGYCHRRNLNYVPDKKKFTRDQERRGLLK